MASDQFVELIRAKLNYPERCHDDLIGFLVQLATECNANFEVTSDWRSDARNRQVGGSPRSWHLEGRAVDMIRANWSPRESWLLMQSIWQAYFNGDMKPLEIRAAKDHIHVAVLPVERESSFGVES